MGSNLSAIIDAAVIDGKQNSIKKNVSRQNFQAIEVNGIQVRYLLAPTDSAEPPLLLCNGLGQSIEVMLPLMRELTGRTLIALDIPGTGRSDFAPSVRTIPEYANFVGRFLDKIGINELDILGISWGGSIAQQLAHDRPKQVRKLVLAITSAGGISSWWGTPIALSEILMPLRYVSKAYGNFIGPWMYGGEAILNPRSFREYARYSIRPTAEGYYSQVQAMCSWTSLPWLHKLEQQTLILAGQFDTLIPITNQALLAQHIPNSELKIFPAGHLMMYTKRHEMAPVITDFLD